MSGDSGNTTSWTDRKGQVMTYSYDALDRQTFVQVQVHLPLYAEIAVIWSSATKEFLAEAVQAPFGMIRGLCQVDPTGPSVNCGQPRDFSQVVLAGRVGVPQLRTASPAVRVLLKATAHQYASRPDLGHRTKAARGDLRVARSALPVVYLR